MPIKNSMSILASRFSVVYKVTLYLLIVLILFSALGFATVYPTMRGVISEINDLHLIRATGSYIVSIFKGVASDATANGSELYANLMSLYRQAIDIIGAHPVQVTVGCILLGLCIFFYFVAMNMGSYPISGILHAFMSTNSEYGFTANYIASMWKSFCYGLANVAFSLIFYALGFSIGLALGFGISKLNKLLGIMVTYMVILTVIAVKRAMCLGWMPSMIVDGMPVKAAFSNAMKMLKTDFVEAFGAYLVIYLTATALAFVIAIASFGTGLILLIAALMMFTNSYDMVLFYRRNGYKYYTDDQTVVDPRRHYKDALIDNPLDLDPKDDDKARGKQREDDPYDPYEQCD